VGRIMTNNDQILVLNTQIYMNFILCLLCEYELSGCVTVKRYESVST